MYNTNVHLPKVQCRFLSVGFSFPIRRLGLQCIRAPLIPISEGFLGLILLRGRTLPNMLLLCKREIFSRQYSTRYLVQPVRGELIPLQARCSFSGRITPQYFPRVILYFYLLPGTNCPVDLVPGSQWICRPIQNRFCDYRRRGCFLLFKRGHFHSIKKGN